MPDDTTPDPSEQPEPDTGHAGWDPRQVMRDRAAATRKTRDDAIAVLRASMDDEKILDEFGIDLGQIER